jgi:hypothetical protein
MALAGPNPLLIQELGVLYVKLAQCDHILILIWLHYLRFKVLGAGQQDFAFSSADRIPHLRLSIDHLSLLSLPLTLIIS